MPSTLDIRRRIRSIKSTRQITKAMELVSAAKMRKAQIAALATRTYSVLARELLQSVSGKAFVRARKLMRRSENAGGKTVIVLMTSNRGLIGGFNAHMADTAIDFAKKCKLAEFVTLGKKGRDIVRKKGVTISADFPKLDTSVGILDIRPLAKVLLDDFSEGKTDKVMLAYSHFISTLKQEPRVQQILPLQRTESSGQDELGEYLFEPSPDEVLETLLPRLIEMQIYQALLETNASEHSARMVAMKNASEAAGDLVSELTLDFNQIRQGAITKEISEIVSGSLAIQ